MLLSWFVKVIPRSPRAFLVMLVMLGSLVVVLATLPELLTASGARASDAAIRVAAATCIGMLATAVFLYLQSETDHR